MGSESCADLKWKVAPALPERSGSRPVQRFEGRRSPCKTVAAQKKSKHARVLRSTRSAVFTMYMTRICRSRRGWRRFVTSFVADSGAEWRGIGKWHGPC